MSTASRRLYDEVLPIAQALARLLQPHAKRLSIAGSLRRQKSEVSDIELVAIPTPALLPAVDDLLRAGVVQEGRPAPPLKVETILWGTPWLYTDGRVWVRRGDDFILVNQEDPRADIYNTGLLMWAKDGECACLCQWLDQMVRVIDDAAQILGVDV